MKDLQLVVVVFSILFDPDASLENMCAVGLRHDVLKLKDLPDTAGRIGSGEVSQVVETSHIYRGDFAWDVLA